MCTVHDANTAEEKQTHTNWLLILLIQLSQLNECMCMCVICGDYYTDSSQLDLASSLSVQLPVRQSTYRINLLSKHEEELITSYLHHISHIHTTFLLLRNKRIINIIHFKFKIDLFSFFHIQPNSILFL